MILSIDHFVLALLKLKLTLVFEDILGNGDYFTLTYL